MQTAAKEESLEFENFMENLQKRQDEEAFMEEMMARHEIWRQTTLMGRIVMFMQYLARHQFVVSFVKVIEESQADDKTLYGIFLINVGRIILIGMIFGFMYLMGYVIKLLIGEEIVIEERVVIIQEQTQSGKNIRTTEVSEGSEILREYQRQQPTLKKSAPSSQRGKRSKKEN